MNSLVTLLAAIGALVVLTTGGLAGCGAEGAKRDTSSNAGTERPADSAGARQATGGEASADSVDKRANTSAGTSDSAKTRLPLSKAVAALAPPSAGPMMATFFAQAVGQVPLPPVVSDALREAQIHAGDVGVFFPEGRWSERAAAVMELVDSLEAQGVRESRLPDGLLASVVSLRETFLAAPGWTGSSPTDEQRARAVAKGELELTSLWYSAIKVLKHDAAMPPWSRRDMAQRILGSILTWHPPQAAVAALLPPTEQYAALMKALATYREHAKTGFTPVPKSVRKAKPHRKHVAIPALRKRLVEEGAVLADVESPVFDKLLNEALKTEREFRQLRGYGKWKRNIDKRLLGLLNTSAETRVATLELNLERWRTSDFHHFDYKVFINLPEFHGEVWDGPERRTRFKTVVGNTKISSGRRINATPKFTARIKRVVYNPTWTVPNRIIHKELIPQAEKKVAEAGEGQSAVDYLRAKGYRVWNEETPRKMKLRRAPGPGNALGKIKFQFDNRYFVFLHDTNSKGKFGHRRRAFSHGCMRVQKPLDLAKVLLKHDGTFWKVRKLRVMNHIRETPVTFKTTIPLVVDYITARVGEDGRTYFLWDMYQRDARRIAKR